MRAMLRPVLFTLAVLPLLVSCDKLHEAGASGSKRGKVRIASTAKPEFAAAFEAISLATREHNRVLVENIEGDGPVNGPAYSAGLAHLDRAARGHGGLTKQVIDAVATTRTYEKSLFIPFDTIRRQMGGMPSWSKDQAIQRRGYIQIIDQQCFTYDDAIAYLERGEEPLLRQNFKKHGVADDVAAEFLRLRRESGMEIAESTLEMFREQRAALQSYRDAMAAADPATANARLAEGHQHEQKAEQAQNRMVAAIRKQLASAGGT
jgi:hypothetical protein